MKRVLTILAILLLPLSVWAMTPISDSQLSDVTGQAGVSINVDVTLDMEFGNLGWGDSDGFAYFNGTYATGANGGWIGIDSLEMSEVHIWPRTDYTMDGSLGAGNGGWDDLRFLTIDVASTPVGNFDEDPFGGAVADVSMVVIGVPTLTITMDEMKGNVVLGPRSTAQTIGGIINGVYTENILNYKYEDGTTYWTSGAKAIAGPEFDQIMGQFYVGGLNMATAGGEVWIFAHGLGSTAGKFGTLYGSGVTIALKEVDVDYILLDEVAWGDIDGVFFKSQYNETFYNTIGLANEGWVGLTDLAIDGLVIDGTLTIDVGHVASAAQLAAAGGLATLDVIDAQNFAGWAWGGLSTVLGSAGLVPSVPAGTYNWAALIPAFNDAYYKQYVDGWVGLNFVNISFVDGFNIDIGAMGATVSLGYGTGVGVPTLTDVMGDIYLGGMSVTILDNPLCGNKSFVHIFAH